MLNNSSENQNFNPQQYIEQTSLLLNLEIKDEYKNGVLTNFERIRAIADLVNSFPLPENMETAPIFEP